MHGNINFRGNNKFIGAYSKLILYNSKLDEEWDSIDYTEFIYHKSKTPKLTEDIAILRINKKCKEISIQEETIIFLGFSETWKGGKTKLRLYNSKLDITWDYTTYDSLIYQSAKRPTIFENNHYLSIINNICKEISTPNEIIEFKGWVGGKYNNEQTKLILYNSKYNITWKTTSYLNFTQGKNKLPNKSEGKRLLSREKFNEAYKVFSSTLEEFKEKYKKKFPNPKERYDLSEAIYITSSIKFAAICHEKDPDGNEHGVFYITPSNLYSGYRCPRCLGYKGENKLENYLLDKNISYMLHYRIPSRNLIDCPNKGYVEIDYYLEYNGRKIFIEFNGQQHYRFIYLFHKNISNFHRQLLRDLSVINYTRDNGIELLEIPYCDLSRVPEILDAFLERGENITTYVPRDLLSGPSLPLGLPLLD